MGTGFFIPPIIDPEDLICVKFNMPNDPLYRQIVRGHLYGLGHGYYWGDDDSEQANDVAQLFLTNLLDSLEMSEDCGCDEGELGQCFRMDTTTEIFDFYPNDPFTDGSNTVGNKIATHLKWIRWGDADLFNLPLIGDIAEDLTNAIVSYFPDDIILALDFIEILNPVARLGDLFEQFTNFPLPFVKIELEGTGQVELELLKLPFGGNVMIIPDLPTDVFDIVETVVGFFDDGVDIPKGWVMLDLDRDITQLDFVPTVIQEFEFEEDGEHTLHAYFIPRLSIDPPFLNPLGGVREIEFCGNIKVIGSQTGTEYSKLNYRSKESVREGFIMSTVDEICKGVMCAIEETAQRILLVNDRTNLVGGISIDPETGKISFPDKGVSGTTGLDISARQALSGSAHRVQVGLDRFIQDIQEYYADVGVSIQMAVLFLGAKYQASGDIITPLQAYWDYRDGSGPALAPFGVAIREHLYCSGINKSTVNTYIIDELATAKELQIQLIDILDESQLNSWSSLGEGIPNDDYLGYACITAPVQVIEPLEKSWPPNAIPYSIGNIGRQYKIEFDGEMVSDTGWRFDGLYIFDTSNDSTYTPTLIKQSGTTLAPSITPVVGSRSAFYDWQKIGVLQNLQVHNNSNFATLASNTLVARIYDLGIVG